MVNAYLFESQNIFNHLIQGICKWSTAEKETYKAMKGEEQAQNKIQRSSLSRSDTMLKSMWPRDGEITSSWRVAPSWFFCKCDERYISCLNLVSTVTPEMEIKPIVLPDAILHLYQKCYPFSILIMMTSRSFYVKDNRGGSRNFEKGGTLCQPPWLIAEENFRFPMV